MPRRDDASCAICMDSLFDARDDLDEVMPITAPDCGHVFHEACLQNWFSMQAQQYLARMREQAVRVRDESPTIDDAPAECPSCRAECYADPETGQPILHRLYINFGDGSAAGSSQAQVPSSPAGPSTQKWGGRRETLDSAGLGIARRAKSLGNEIQALHPDSSEDDVAGAMRRAEGLEADARALSDKTTMGLKKYIGGLTVALNALRTELQTHPLIGTLRGQIAELQEANNRQIAMMQSMERHTIPAAVKKAVEAEQRKSEKAVRAAEAQRDLIQRELEKEQVARVSFKRAMKERELELERRLESINKKLQKEEEDREALQTQLADRTKLMKMYHARAEKSKQLQAQIEQLKLENERLRKDAECASASVGVKTPRPEERGDNYDDYGNYGNDGDDALEITLGDDDEDGLVPVPPPPPVTSRTRPAPDSLDVYMPSPDEEPGPSRRSVTARTFTFDVDEGRVKTSRSKKDKGKEKEKDREREKGKENDRGGEKDGSRDAGLHKTPRVKETARSSKYFSRASTTAAEDAGDVSEREPRKRRPGLFDDGEEEDQVLVAASSPPGSPRPSPSPSKRPRTNPSPSPLTSTSSANTASTTNASSNPFKTTVKKTTKSTTPALPAPQYHSSPPEVIDLVSSSPPRARALARSVSASTSGANRFALGTTPGGNGKGKSKSMLEILGVADERGRIKKGVAVGSKIKRRA